MSMKTIFIFFLSFCFADDNTPSESVFSKLKDKRRSIGMSWEDVSVSPRKLRRDLNESEKLEIIQSDEIPPNDYSAEAVAKSLLHVSSV